MEELECHIRHSMLINSTESWTIVASSNDFHFDKVVQIPHQTSGGGLIG